MPKKLLSNHLAYSWWTNPVAIKEAGTNNILYTGIKDDGDPRIFRLKPTDPDNNPSAIQNHILFEAPELDDHNSPSIATSQGRDLIVFWQRHGASSQINYWKAPEGTFNFGAKQVIYFPGTVTYSQIAHYQNTIYVFTRVDAYFWYFVKSTDWGNTWSTPVKLFDGVAFGGQHYMLIKPFPSDPTKYQMVFYGHPTSSTWRDVTYGEFDITNGNITSPNGFTANLSGTNLPIVNSSLSIAWTPPAGDYKIRLFDVGIKHGKPVILGGRFNSVDLNATYRFIHLDSGNTWVETPLIRSNGAFDNGLGRMYAYGGCFDNNNSNKVYLAYKYNGANHYQLDQYSVDASFGIHSQIVIQNDNLQLVRPYGVYNDTAMIFQELYYYNSYTNFDIKLWLYKEV